MKRVRLGIIGCGVIGSHHLKAAAAADHIEIAAVSDLRGDVARKAAAQYGVPRVYEDGSALLADPDVEAVVLAMPAKGRAQLAVDAFSQGKHVLTEKPVARSVEELKTMLAAQGDLVGACCSSRYSFLRWAQVASELVASGRLGRVRSVYCRNFSPAGPIPKKMPPAWRLSKDLQGGGILVNWGCYEFDYLLGILHWSLVPQVVFAQTWPVPPQRIGTVPPNSDAETHYAAMIRCEDDILLHVERGEMMSIAGESSWQIIGERGSLRLDMIPGQGDHVVLDESSDERGIVTEVVDSTPGTWDEVNAGPVTDFADAILTGRPPKTSLQNALTIQRITSAIYASAESGQAITLGSAD